MFSSYICPHSNPFRFSSRQRKDKQKNDYKSNKIIFLQPTAIENLRKWTSQEAIGDITVGTDAVSRVLSCSSANNSQFAMSRDETDDTLHSTYNNSSAITSRSNTNDSINDATLDHRLPSPEEQQKIIALKWVFFAIFFLRKTIQFFISHQISSRNDSRRCVRKTLRPNVSCPQIPSSCPNGRRSSHKSRWGWSRRRRSRKWRRHDKTKVALEKAEGETKKYDCRHWREGNSGSSEWVSFELIW